MDEALTEAIKTGLTSVVLPMIVAVLTFLASDRLTDGKKRQEQSKLGVAVLQSLEEEIVTGIATMKQALAASHDLSTLLPPGSLLPSKTWSGMQTISDDVFMRLIEVSESEPTQGFPLRECRTHLKNYFDHIVGNVNAATAAAATFGADRDLQWRAVLNRAIGDEATGYIASSEKVLTMVRHGQALLAANARRFRPK